MRRPCLSTTAGSSPSRSKSLSKDARCGRADGRAMANEVGGLDPFNQTVTDMSDQLGLVDQNLGGPAVNEVV